MPTSNEQGTRTANHGSWPTMLWLAAFLSSFTHLKDIPILFSKSNFDLKLVAHMAHISESRMVAHFLLFQFWHTLWHAPGTHPPVSGTHSKITSNEPTNHEPSLSIRVTRSSVGFSYELVNSDRFIISCSTIP